MHGSRIVTVGNERVPQVDARASRLAWMTFAAVASIVAFANAGIYIVRAGNPLVTSDAWYFIVVFLRGAMESGADVQDFFVKRGAFDHAQPLHKLLLLLNAKWFGLDFVYEALAGLAFALAMFMVIVLSSREIRNGQSSSHRALAIAALAGSLVTLGCGMVFDWSLVTLMYLPYLFATLGAIAGWRFVVHGSRAWLWCAALCIAFSFDDVGVIINAAVAGACLMAAGRLRRWRAGGSAVAVIVICEAAYLLVSRLVLQPPTDLPGGSPQLPLPELLSQATTIVRIGLGSTFVHINPLTHYFGDAAVGVQSGLALIAAAAHGWFWWRALRGSWSAPVFIGVVLMLSFYAFLAGIVYARVALNGAAYMHEPRYMVFYLLSSVALICMLLGQTNRKAGSRGGSLAHASLLALILLQVPLSQYTWGQSQYLAPYYHQMAWQMLVLGRGSVPESCVAMLTVCGYSETNRREAMHFLRQHRLNVFSPAFVERYRLRRLVNAAEETL